MHVMSLLPSLSDSSSRHFPFSRVSKRSDLISVIAAAPMLSSPQKRRGGRGKCDGAVGGKKQELEREKESESRNIPPKLANCSVNTNTGLGSGSGRGL